MPRLLAHCDVFVMGLACSRLIDKHRHCVSVTFFSWDLCYYFEKNHGGASWKENASAATQHERQDLIHCSIEFD